MHFCYFAIQSSVFFLQVCVKKYISALLPISKTRETRKNCTKMLFVVIILRPILLSEWCAPVWRQNAVDTTLGKKNGNDGQLKRHYFVVRVVRPRLASECGRYHARQKMATMDSTKAYSHCCHFLLAEVGIRIITPNYSWW